MYIIKENIAKKIRQKYKMQYISDKADVSQAYLSLIFNGKKHCSKKTARLIVKAINPNYEIKDLFIKIN